VSHVAIAYILNQSKGLWLSNDGLNVAISMSLKLKDKTNHLPLSNVLINDIDDSGLTIELETFAKNIKKEFIMVINSFLSFLKRYNKRKTHNLLDLMLNPRFKSLRLIYSFIGHEHRVTIVEKYDKKSLVSYVILVLSSFASIVQS